MSVTMQKMINFHLTGKRGDDEVADGPASNACPALLVPYRRLSELRYDFPLVLLDDAASPAFADTLSGIFNRLIRDIAPEGNAGEQLRQHILQLEKRMRELASDGVDWSLSKLWQDAETSLLAERKGPDAELLGNSFATARFAFNVEGQVVNCDEQLPARLLQHAYKAIEAKRAKQSIGKIELLIIKLRNILQVDDRKNGASQTPQQLKKDVGKRYKESFDFDLMSEILKDSTPGNRLPDERRKRIKAALAVLESQRFFTPATAGRNRKGRGQYQFIADNLSAALKSYDERLPQMAELIKAISIAELECENAYREETHSAYFTRFGPQALTPEDLELFPPYLICLQESECNARDMEHLMEISSGDLPMKVLMQVTDALTHRSGRTLTAPGNAFVLQSTASNLYRQCKWIRKGLEFDGPAVFSVFAPRNDGATELPAYLIAAAAMESRVFPAFSYDPVAGPGLADRFDISSNPEVASDWPTRELSYEDQELQMVVEESAFTAADFAVIAPEYCEHFAAAPKHSWSREMLPVADYLKLANSETVERVPYVAVVDGDNFLRRFVVDDKLIRIVRRCRERWHALQELGGVNNSYSAAALEKVPAVPVAPTVEVAPPLVTEEAASVVVEKQEEIEEQQPGAVDEPYIETPLCTTCDECTKRNDRMFAYDENKQAFVKDPDAGTYRQLVEAAELCQVAIIHPGKPRNPGEPGLDELVARAAAFAP